MNDRRSMPKINHLIFLLILIVAAFLRVYRFLDIPFTQDEFSAIFRAGYTSFADLIEHGVKPDGHPAGIQVLIFLLIRIFGVSEPALKIPFLLFGLLSLVLAYRIAGAWYNDTVALLTTSLLAVLQYMIYYSQVARPYMSGMFFSLWMVWCWTKWITNPRGNVLKHATGLVLAAICCCYNHYFSMLFAAIVWLTGLFLIEKRSLRYYLLSGLLVVLAYLPHLPVLLHQITMKGVGEWLAKPGIDFLTDYIGYIFHFSILLMLVTGLTGIAGFIFRSKERSINPPFRLIAIVWFIILLATGYIYSLFVSAVLQFSVLIFAFPFLVIVLFSYFPEIRVSWKILLVSLILVTGTLTLFLNRHHYDLLCESGPGKILEETVTCIEKYGNDQVSVIFHADRRSVEYMLHSMQADLEQEVHYVEHSTTFSDFREYLSGLETEHLVYAWTAPLALEYEALVREYFPVHLEHTESFLTEFHLFSRNGEKRDSGAAIWSERIGFEEGEPLPLLHPDRITDTLSATGGRCYLVDSITLYGPSFHLDLDGTGLARNDYIAVTLSIFLPDPGSNPIIVGSVVSEGHELIWRGNAARDFVPGSDQWGKAYLTVRLPARILREKNLGFMTYLWNREEADFYIDDFELAIYAGNRRLYGLFEKIE